MKNPFTEAEEADYQYEMMLRRKERERQEREDALDIVENDDD
jgi:hypothetical protein